MREPTWDNPNKMHMETGHKAFDAQTVVLGPGNIIAPTLIGSYIRPRNEIINPVGEKREPGYLLEWDLNNSMSDVPPHIKNYIRTNCIDHPMILYKVKHRSRNKTIVHGFIITGGHDQNHKIIKIFPCNFSMKSVKILHKVKEYISNEANN